MRLGSHIYSETILFGKFLDYTQNIWKPNRFYLWWSFPKKKKNKPKPPKFSIKAWLFVLILEIQFSAYRYVSTGSWVIELSKSFPRKTASRFQVLPFPFCFLIYKIDSKVHFCDYSFMSSNKCMEACNYHHIQDIQQLQKKWLVDLLL